MNTPAITARWRHPAEWEPHAATWLIWPHTRMDWPGKLTAVVWDFAEMVRVLARDEIVRIIVLNASHERRARVILEAAHTPLAHVEFFKIPSDRSWARDAGPIFLRPAGGGPAHVAHFDFNAWGRRDHYEKDAAIPERAARALGLPRVVPQHHGRPIVLEGGAIDVNGGGTVLSTEECLLDPQVQVRNPGFSRGDYERVFSEWLGADQAIWLHRGITGDTDTHGHVDDVCRFVKHDTVVLATEQNIRDDNYAALQENRERLQRVRLANGESLRVVDLPLPAPLWFRGKRLPASYANFYIGNHTILVPTFNDPADRQALGILAELFPGRCVTGVHCVDILLGLGSVHCLTHEQPA